MRRIPRSKVPFPKYLVLRHAISLALDRIGTKLTEVQWKPIVKALVTIGSNDVLHSLCCIWWLNKSYTFTFSNGILELPSDLHPFVITLSALWLIGIVTLTNSKATNS